MQKLNRVQKRTVAVNRWVEQLEQRRLLTAQLSFTDFSSTTGLAFNGYGSSPTTSNNQLVLTDGTGEARSVLSTTKVPTNTFTAHFTYQVSASSNQADGFAFVLDNGSSTDLGSEGQYFGYTNGTFGTNSVALAFDLYNNMQGGTYFGEGQGGTVINATTNATPLDLHNGDKYDFTVTYDGTNLTVSAVDEVNSALNFSNSTPINLASVLGGTTANVGFTGATGFETSNQNITAFDYTGVPAVVTPTGPTITAPASSNPTIVTSTKSHLTVGATTTTGGTLSYAWSIVRVPPGAPTPTLTPNNTTSPTTTAHYFKDGTYTFQVTVTDSSTGDTATSIEQVVVEQTATAVKLTPHKAQIVVNHTEQYTGVIDDQFGRALRTLPTLDYEVDTGDGSIDSLTGLYTAVDTRGHLVISVTGDDLTGTAGATR